MNPDQLIESLDLKALEGEGGLWAPLYRDHESNAIYFMMIAPDFSAWHRLTEPELWVQIDGGPLQLNTIEGGHLIVRILDRNSGNYSYRVPANTWMSATPLESWSLAICTLTPPFSGMELATRQHLITELADNEVLPELFHG